MSRTNGEKDLAALRPRRSKVGHPRLPHSPGRSVFAAECGTSRAKTCAPSCPRTLWLWTFLCSDSVKGTGKVVSKGGIKGSFLDIDMYIGQSHSHDMARKLRGEFAGAHHESW